MRTLYGPLTKLSSFALFLIATISLAGATQVYKRVMPDGSVSYSDEPQEGAQAITIQAITTVPALKIDNISNETNEAKTEQYKYTSLKITNPENNSAFNSGSGTVRIAYTSTPSLLNGHKFKVFFGRELVAEHTATEVILPHIDRGTHTISVHIVDRADAILLSNSSTFTIHRPSKKH